MNHMLNRKFVRITREELYRRVWEVPIQTIAREFGIADVGLAKSCRRARIPVPGRGYWAKKAAGKHVDVLPLPELQPDELAVPRVIELWSTPEREPPPVLVREQMEFESRPENRLVVASTLRNPHPLVKETLDALQGNTNTRSHDYLGNWKVKHLDVEVSKPLLNRALRIIDAVVRGFEKRGWEVSLGRDDHRSFVTIFGQPVPFGIREPRRLLKVERSERRFLEPSKREEPSGRLALVLREYWGRSINKSFDESKKGPLEEKLNDFMISAVALAHERAEWERRRVERDDRQRREARIRVERQRLRDAETARIRELEESAERWQRSKAIRELVIAVRTAAAANGGQPDSPALVDWLAWAETHASGLDPIDRILRSLEN